MKRIRNEKRWRSTRIEIRAPRIGGEFLVDIYLMSDAYLGLDQQYQTVCQVENVGMSDPLNELA